MGDQKLLTRFREFCETNKVDCVFKGVVEYCDKIDIVDQERLNHGFFVNSESGTRYVRLGSIRKPPVATDDPVIVVGREIKYLIERYSKHVTNSVEPAVLLIPYEQIISFSTDLRPRSRGNLVYWSIPYIIGYGLLFGMIWIDLLRQWWIFAPSLALLACTQIAEVLFENRPRQPRHYRCDNETWQALLDEVESMMM